MTFPDSSVFFNFQRFGLENLESLEVQFDFEDFPSEIFENLKNHENIKNLEIQTEFLEFHNFSINFQDFALKV